MAKIVDTVPRSKGNEFDSNRHYLQLLLLLLLSLKVKDLACRIDKVFRLLMFDRNFSSWHCMVKEQVIVLFVIVFLVFDI